MVIILMILPAMTLTPNENVSTRPMHNHPVASVQVAMLKM